MRNAMLPVVTVIGLEFAFLIGGLVVTEQVFNINGIGKLFVDAAIRGDFTLIQGLVLMIAVIIAHVYIGSIGMEGAFEAMGSGDVDLNWARAHHDLGVEEMERKGMVRMPAE